MLLVILTWGCMLLQSGAMVAKKLFADDKITAWVKQICLLGVKFSIEKHCLVKHCIFFEKRLLALLKIVLRVTYCFLIGYWLAHNQLSWNVLVLSCNPIGQLCLCGPGYSSRTVIQSTTTTPIGPRGGHTIKQNTWNITAFWKPFNTHVLTHWQPCWPNLAVQDYTALKYCNFLNHQKWP